MEEDERWGRDLDLAINVIYKDANDTVLPVRASSKTEAKNVIVLLLFHTVCSSQEGMHYAYVPFPDRIFRDRYKDNAGRHQSRQSFPCWNCLTTQSTYLAHTHHQRFCLDNETQEVLLPKEGAVMAFDEEGQRDEGEKSLSRKIFNLAYLLFYDFETLQIKTRHPCSCPAEVIENTKKYYEELEEWEAMTEEERSEVAADLCMDAASSDEEGEMEAIASSELHDILGPYDTFPTPMSEKEAVRKRKKRKKSMACKKSKQRVKKVKLCPHKTRVLYEHEPFMCSYILVTRDGTVVTERTIIGEDCVEQFLEDVVALADRYLPPTLSPGLPLVMTKKDKRLLQEAKECYLCGQGFENDMKVADHDHLTGDFLGAAHNICNINRKERQELVCFAHNFSGFDSHLLVKAIGKRRDLVRSVSAIPLNTQKFKCMTLNNRIRLLDSYAFLPDSLSRLTDNLRASNCSFNFLNEP